jgi:hypothetical protein
VRKVGEGGATGALPIAGEQKIEQVRNDRAVEPVRPPPALTGAERIALARSASATSKTNLVEAKRLAFSRPPGELSQLLKREIARACDFVNTVRVAFTFFGGARIPKDHPLYELGKEWGEALFLANLTAEDPVLGVRAIASGLY